VDQVEEVADAHVTLQERAFGRRDDALAVLLRQFVHARDRDSIEPKSEQRLRSLRRQSGGVGLNDLLKDFAFCLLLAGAQNQPAVGA
jgi:hypothetical protein